MVLSSSEIRTDSLVTSIVTGDYRTSAIFRKYGIDYCCGGRIPLQTACERLGLDTDIVLDELNNAIRNIQVSGSTNFANWKVDFLIDYIINIHHHYLTQNLPAIADSVERFVEMHQKKYPHLPEMVHLVAELQKNLLPHLVQEEKVIFPYIKQVTHAYENREPYAALLVRTLRKPIENLMSGEHGQISKYLRAMRALTDNYKAPEKACLSHKVALFRLKELDDDLVQHVHLESNILFPKAIAMEREMLQSK